MDWDTWHMEQSAHMPATLWMAFGMGERLYVGFTLSCVDLLIFWSFDILIFWSFDLLINTGPVSWWWMAWPTAGYKDWFCLLQNLGDKLFYVTSLGARTPWKEWDKSFLRMGLHTMACSRVTCGTGELQENCFTLVYKTHLYFFIIRSGIRKNTDGTVCTEVNACPFLVLFWFLYFVSLGVCEWLSCRPWRSCPRRSQEENKTPTTAHMCVLCDHSGGYEEMRAMWQSVLLWSRVPKARLARESQTKLCHDWHRDRHRRRQLGCTRSWLIFRLQ
jgi:hypothetical protein